MNIYIYTHKIVFFCRFSFGSYDLILVTCMFIVGTYDTIMVSCMFVIVAFCRRRTPRPRCLCSSFVLAVLVLLSDYCH